MKSISLATTRTLACSSVLALALSGGAAFAQSTSSPPPAYGEESASATQAQPLQSPEQQPPGSQDMAAGQQASPPSDEQSMAAAGQPSMDSQPAEQVQIISGQQSGSDPEQAAQMIGRPLLNQQGEELGSVENIVRDPQDQQLKAVVASNGGFMGIGGKQVVVPVSELRLMERSDLEQMSQAQQPPQDQQQAQQQQQEQQQAQQEQQEQGDLVVVIQSDITQEGLEQMTAYVEENFQEVPIYSGGQQQSPQG